MRAPQLLARARSLENKKMNHQQATDEAFSTSFPFYFIIIIYGSAEFTPPRTIFSTCTIVRLKEPAHFTSLKALAIVSKLKSVESQKVSLFQNSIRPVHTQENFYKMFRITSLSLVVACLLRENESFSVNPTVRGPSVLLTPCQDAKKTFCWELNLSSEKEENVAVDVESLSGEQKKEVVGNLVADDEWQGVTMELTELVRLAILEDVKKNTRDFLGKDDYNVGDISKEIDGRVKSEVAKIRNKDGKKYCADCRS